MKKTVSVVLAFLFTVCLFGCANSGGAGGEAAKRSGSNAKDGADGQAKEPTYFEECGFLAAPDSVIDGISSNGSSKTTTNGVVTEIQYHYTDNGSGGEGFQKYIDYLKQSGLVVQAVANNECDEYAVMHDSMKAASVKSSGNKITVEIIPEEFRVVTVTEAVPVGSTKTLDFAVLTFNKIEMGKEVYPEDTSGVHLYYQETAGSTYVTLRGRVKNTSAENLSGDEIDAALSINGKYNYSGEVIFGANPASMTNYSITPFEESPLYVVFSVPDEALEVMTEGTITFRFNENFARGAGEYAYVYTFSVPN